MADARQEGEFYTDEQIELLGEFFEVFPDAQIDDLTADREFLGQEWFKALLEEDAIQFRIRIRESDNLSDGCQPLKAKVVLSDLKVGQQKVLRRQVWGHWLYVAVYDWRMANC